MSKARVCHVVELSHIGGCERAFSSFIHHPRDQHRIENHLLVGTRRIHPFLRDSVRADVRSVLHYHSWRGVRIPRFMRPFAALRRLKQIACDYIVIWNMFADRRLLNLGEELQVPVLHFERGMAWWSHADEAAAKYVRGLRGVVSNSHAGKRMLELRFGWTGSTRVCPNGLRREISPPTPQRKRLDSKRALKIGVAARLLPFKGQVLAIHALRVLIDKGVVAQLHLAGTGPDESRLRDLAATLGVDSAVRFHGLVRDMREFYRLIKVFLCPSLREPFGSVSIEAAAWGCPVIAADVDGLPETVVPGETGILLRPSLPIDSYETYGGSLNRVPKVVYNPQSDSLERPRLIDPTDIADSIAELADSQARFGCMSANASEHATSAFEYDRHLDAVDNAFTELSHKCEVGAFAGSDRSQA